MDYEHKSNSNISVEEGNLQQTKLLKFGKLFSWITCLRILFSWKKFVEVGFSFRSLSMVANDRRFLNRVFWILSSKLSWKLPISLKCYSWKFFWKRTLIYFHSPKANFSHSWTNLERRTSEYGYNDLLYTAQFSIMWVFSRYVWSKIFGKSEVGNLHVELKFDLIRNSIRTFCERYSKKRQIGISIWQNCFTSWTWK